MSPNITTNGLNDLLIGFAKVSLGANFLVRPHLYHSGSIIFQLPGRRDWPRTDAGNLRCDISPRLQSKHGSRP